MPPRGMLGRRVEGIFCARPQRRIRGARRRPMFYDPGCSGRVELGTLPVDVQRRLAALPGEWLEFDAPSGAIVVRYVQPTSSPSLPTIAGELVRIISEIPGARPPAIAGGGLDVPPAQTLRLV